MRPTPSLGEYWDMADSIALHIIAQAAALRLSFPQASALEVLDEVMEGHHGCDLDFSAGRSELFGDWTDPASPFGELLRLAFAPDEVSSDAGQLWLSLDADESPASDSLVDAWQTKVVERFAARYKLWGN